MWAIVWHIDMGGWVVWCPVTHAVMQGPYRSFADAEEAVKTRAWRIAQGWAP